MNGPVPIGLRPYSLAPFTSVQYFGGTTKNRLSVSSIGGTGSEVSIVTVRSSILVAFLKLSK